MGKNCPFCGAEMPEEANFCLTCFSMCTVPEATGTGTVFKRKKTIFQPKGRRWAERLVAAVLTLVLMVGTALSAFTSFREIPVSAQSPDASAAEQNGEPGDEEIQGQPATDPAGDATTQETGDVPHLLSPTGSLFSKVPGLESITGTPTLTEPGNVGTQTGTSFDTQQKPDSTGGGSSADKDDENPTESGGNTVAEPDEPTPTEPEYDNFEYMSYDSKNDKITLIKYKGNSKKVLVPAVIDGKPVARIEEDTFSDNSNIQEIIFESNPAQTFLWLDSGCMTNLTELKTVRMPDTDLGIYTQFAINCRKLADIDIDNSQYRFEDGALYYWSSRRWELRYYAPACKNETLTVASWCAGIDGACNLDENPYLKRIVLHKNVTMFPSNYKINDALEEVYVEPGNANGFSVDGVLFYKNNNGVYTGSLYPPSKKDKSFVMPENVTMNVYRYYCPYLEEIWIPASSRVNAPDTLYFRRCFTNLKVIHLQKGHSYEAECKSTFTGKTEMY